MRIDRASSKKTNIWEKYNAFIVFITKKHPAANIDLFLLCNNESITNKAQNAASKTGLHSVDHLTAQITTYTGTGIHIKSD